MTQFESPSRQIILDTETTGINPKDGHRIIEIGCVEMIDRKLTGNHFHVYINPERVVEQEAINVHGITNEFLEDKPVFAQVASDFIEFIKGAELVIHNAPFDVGFLDHEFSLLSPAPGEIADFSTVFDTLVFARKQFPGQRASLDALCKRYDIDNSHRTLHGALLDAEILAEVYLFLTGGQRKLGFQGAQSESDSDDAQAIVKLDSNRPKLKVLRASAEEDKRHQEYLEGLAKNGECIWSQIESVSE
ncbi:MULTISPECIES: DNA polymerase III subunit epsilon [Gammaproteobacteria]|uniref:DNA polymerase III subunit epsilon n=1 Tax=Gammaproteobacteria TaxID=1236 RepID=UPI000DD02E42|nr:MULTISPECIES: DNA polymerase III subunit epsilon [Gammaproteobacteria]RTE87516.1 DNA polymerase III subunit epsilon [Aliidiomarina sp. B3213]TCZ92699.1 DNA polymerase III subunit epsilon [Lysobacter sp. N42]